MKTIIHSRIFDRQYRTYAFYLLTAACGLTALWYASNLYSLISRTVATQRVDTQMASLGGAVSILDGQYMKISGALTPDKLSAYDLKQGKVSSYIRRSGSLGVAYTGHEL